MCEIWTLENRMSGPRNNCLILGAGRSGTSLTALLLERAGYHVYQTAVPPDEGNPFGYFEDTEVLAANEAILKSTYRSAQQRLRRAIRRKPDISSVGAWLLDLDYRRRWNSHIRLKTEVRLRNGVKCIHGQNGLLSTIYYGKLHRKD